MVLRLFGLKKKDKTQPPAVAPAATEPAEAPVEFQEEALGGPDTAPARPIAGKATKKAASKKAAPKPKAKTAAKKAPARKTTGKKTASKKR